MVSFEMKANRYSWVNDSSQNKSFIIDQYGKIGKITIVINGSTDTVYKVWV